MNKPKAKIFIDGANVFYTQRHLGWSVDWDKAIKMVSAEFDVLETRYYTGIKDGDKGMKTFLQHLRKIGIKTVTKPLKVITDKEKAIHYKSNCDVEMAIDIILDINTFEVLILFSGDSDFVYLIKVLQDQFQKKVVVYSSRKTIAWEVRLVADEHHFFEDIKENINRRLLGGTVKQE